MPQDKFVIGIDFGTESGRVVVVRVRDGEEMAAAVVPYPDGVLDEKLPGSARLEPDSASAKPSRLPLGAGEGRPQGAQRSRRKG